MGGYVEKLRLADRTEAILRRDRQLLKKNAPRQQPEPAILLTIVPEVGSVIDLLDAYMPDVADAAGLQYVRIVGAEHRELPGPLLEQTFLTVADLTGRDETVITLVYQALSRGRRVLLTAQSPSELPADLGHIPHVYYDLDKGLFDALLRAVRQASCSAMEDVAALS